MPSSHLTPEALAQISGGVLTCPIVNGRDGSAAAALEEGDVLLEVAPPESAGQFGAVQEWLLTQGALAVAEFVEHLQKGTIEPETIARLLKNALLWNPPPPGIAGVVCGHDTAGLSDLRSMLGDREPSCVGFDKGAKQYGDDEFILFERDGALEWARCLLGVLEMLVTHERILSPVARASSTTYPQHGSGFFLDGSEYCLEVFMDGLLGKFEDVNGCTDEYLRTQQATGRDTGRVDNAPLAGTPFMAGKLCSEREAQVRASLFGGATGHGGKDHAVHFIVLLAHRYLIACRVAYVQHSKWGLIFGKDTVCLQGPHANKWFRHRLHNALPGFPMDLATYGDCPCLIVAATHVYAHLHPLALHAHPPYATISHRSTDSKGKVSEKHVDAGQLDFWLYDSAVHSLTTQHRFGVMMQVMGETGRGRGRKDLRKYTCTLSTGKNVYWFHGRDFPHYTALRSVLADLNLPWALTRAELRYACGVPWVTRILASLSSKCIIVADNMQQPWTSSQWLHADSVMRNAEWSAPHAPLPYLPEVHTPLLRHACPRCCTPTLHTRCTPSVHIHAPFVQACTHAPFLTGLQPTLC